MRVRARSCVTAGVALVGASAIAIQPVNPLSADAIPVTQHAVQLAAVPSPIQLYPQVFQQSLSNAGALLQQYFEDPFPITSAILRNQAAAVTDAVAALQAGDSEAFLTAAADAVLEPLRGAGIAATHLGAILSQPYALQGYFLIAVSPVLAGVVATQRAFGEVFDALVGLDLVGAAYAVLNIPARVIDGVLNGVQGAPFGILEDLPGLLTPLGEGGIAGPIAVGTTLDQDMGAAIPPRESTTDVGGLPDLDAATFAVTVVDTADDTAADDTGRTGSVADDTEADDTASQDSANADADADTDTAESGAEPAAAPRKSGKPAKGQAERARTEAGSDTDSSAGGSDGDPSPDKAAA